MIEVSHLTKKYGSRLAVDDISFTVEDGVIYLSLIHISEPTRRS